MNKEIILEPIGGLANRMRVIASGLWLARTNNLKVKLIWNINSDLNSKFEDLFEPIENLELINKRFIYNLFRSSCEKKNIKRSIIKIVNNTIALNYQIIEDYEVVKIRQGELDVSNLCKTNKTIYFRTCAEFGEATDKFIQFIPKQNIKKRIIDCSRHFNDKTIGVHIRRTDHKIAIHKSPTELFINQMKDDLEMKPGINFFLSTDDPQTESNIKNVFGDRVLTIEKVFSRDAPQGIQDAVVDLFCLANCAKIYGSYWSSFSHLAARIRNIPLEYQKKE